MSAKKLLKYLLALIGVTLMLAIIPVFFPTNVMALIHEWLGLGEFPQRPIALYLARSASLLYAVHGTLLLFVSFQLDRYQKLVVVIGWLHVLIGIVMLGIDLLESMPWYWIAGEGPPIVMGGIAILVLCKFAFLNDVNTAQPRIKKIGVYDFELPDWWQQITVDIPREFKLTEEAGDDERFCDYVRERFGNDCGTPENWRETLKAWAMYGEHQTGLPVHLAHCLMTGSEFVCAAKVYSELFLLAPTQPSKQNWFECYLAHSAGRAWLELGELRLAKLWLLRSIACRPNHNIKNAICYYADQSQELLDTLTSSEVATSSMVQKQIRTMQQ